MARELLKLFTCTEPPANSPGYTTSTGQESSFSLMPSGAGASCRRRNLIKTNKKHIILMFFYHCSSFFCSICVFCVLARARAQPTRGRKNWHFEILRAFRALRAREGVLLYTLQNLRIPKEKAFRRNHVELRQNIITAISSEPSR